MEKNGRISLSTDLLTDLTIACSRWLILNQISKDHKDNDLILYSTKIKQVDNTEYKFKSLNLNHGGKYIMIEINSSFTVGEVRFCDNRRLVIPNIKGFFVFKEKVLLNSFISWDVVNFNMKIDHPEIMGFNEFSYDSHSKIPKGDMFRSINERNAKFLSFYKDVSQKINNHYVYA